jgi:hypothetical protein
VMWGRSSEYGFMDISWNSLSQQNESDSWAGSPAQLLEMMLLSIQRCRARPALPANAHCPP